MSVSECANCETTAGKLMGCSKCQLAMYCSQKCQQAHWPTHRKTCRISKGTGSIRNMRHFEPVPGDSTKDKNQVVIDNLNYIFHEIPPESRDAAVAEFVNEIKQQRAAYTSQGNLLGRSQSYLALVLVYLKGNRFTDAKSAIKRCIETVKDMDIDIASGRVSVDADTIAEMKSAIEWNHNVIDSAMLKRDNDITYDEIQLMLPGPLRNEASHCLIKKLFVEQNLFLKQEDYNQCVIIDIRCIELATYVSQDEDKDDSKSRAAKIVINRIKHADSLMQKYSASMQVPVKEAYAMLRNSDYFVSLFTMAAQ